MDNLQLEEEIDAARSEEVRIIIERMPTKFGFFITLIVAIVFFLFFFFAWIIRYPDVVSGQVTINSASAPLKLVANTSGKLRLLNLKSLDDIKQGQIIGYLESSTNPKNVLKVKSLLKNCDLHHDGIFEAYSRLPKNLSLGELNERYYSLITALQQWINFQNDAFYTKQERNLATILTEQLNSINTAQKRIDISMKTLNFLYKFYKRDSLLVSKNVISESEHDKSFLNYISAKDTYENASNTLLNIRQQAQQTEGKIEEIGIIKSEKQKDLYADLISSYNLLQDDLEKWEQKYIFRSPYNGKIQFLNFYSDNQFVQAGEQVFSVIPKQKNPIGQVTIPSKGSGKIKVGQEVFIKLDDFPYLEYGYVMAMVIEISMASNTRTNPGKTGEIETYQLVVSFPNNLTTNYGYELHNKPEAKGTAEVVTNDRRLIERLFDNLKYATAK